MEPTTPVLHLHPVKTAGSSIIKTVIKCFSQPVQNLYANSSTGSIHILPGIAGTTPEDYLSLSVRNPYQRFVSMVRFYPKFLEFAGQETNIPIPVGTFYYNMRKMQFHKKDVSAKSKIYFTLWATQTDWYNLAKGKIAVIKFETLEQDIERVYGLTETADNPFLHIHKFHRGYDLNDWITAFPSQDKLNLFNDIVASDFEMFGYERFDHIDDLFQSFITP